MGKCVFCGKCNNNKENITVHKFPRDEASWKEWVKIIGRDGWVPSKHSVLCSDHFTEDSFAVYSNRTKKRIKPGAVPIIEPKKNISVENNCAVHSPDSFGIPIVGNVPEPIVTIRLAENSAYWKYIIECSHPTENIRESNVAKECTDSSTSKEDILHSPDIFGTPTVEKVPESTGILELTDNPTDSEHLIKFSHVTDNICEANVAEECADRSTSKKDIFGGCDYSADQSTPNTTRPLVKCLPQTTYQDIIHDHHYEISPRSTKKTLNIVRRKLEVSRKEAKTLKKQVDRLKNKVNFLLDLVNELKKRKLSSESAYHCLSAR